LIAQCESERCFAPFISTTKSTLLLCRSPLIQLARGADPIKLGEMNKTPSDFPRRKRLLIYLPEEDGAKINNSECCAGPKSINAGRVRLESGCAAKGILITNKLCYQSARRGVLLSQNL
jgi:hypothetical protein